MENAAGNARWQPTHPVREHTGNVRDGDRTPVGIAKIQKETRAQKHRARVLIRVLDSEFQARPANLIALAFIGNDYRRPLNQTSFHLCSLFEFCL